MVDGECPAKKPQLECVSGEKNVQEGEQRRCFLASPSVGTGGQGQIWFGGAVSILPLSNPKKRDSGEGLLTWKH